MANVTYQVLSSIKQIASTKVLQKHKFSEEVEPECLKLNTTNNEVYTMALDFIAGCLGGMGGVLVSHPLDTVKVHLQTQDPKNPKFHGVWHCLKSLVAQENIFALYKGVTSPLAGLAFVNAIVFGIYGNVLRLNSDPNALSSHVLAGGVAGFFQSVVCSPMELAKTRIQLQDNSIKERKFKGPLDCIIHIGRTEGLHGIYKGFLITAARDIPGFAAYFSSYEYMMRLSSQPNNIYTLCAGGLAGIFSWLVCYPIDVVKTCIQADNPAQPIYKNYMDVVYKGYQSEGVHFFFRGITSTMIRSFPMNAVTFSIVSMFMGYFQPDNISSVLYDGDVQSFKNLMKNLSMHTAYNYAELQKSPKKKQQQKEWLSFSPQQQQKHLTTFGTFSEAVEETEAFELATTSASEEICNILDKSNNNDNLNLRIIDE